MRRSTTSLACALGLLLTLPACKSKKGPPPPAGAGDAVSLSMLLKDPKLLIIDVRTPKEFDSGHIPKAINIPLSQFAAKAAQRIGPDKGRAVIVHCLSGARSERALHMLTEMGYGKAINGGGVRALAAKMGVKLK